MRRRRATPVRTDSFMLAANATYVYVVDNTQKKAYRVKKLGGNVAEDITPSKAALPDPCSSVMVDPMTSVAYCTGGTPGVTGLLPPSTSSPPSTETARSHSRKTPPRSTGRRTE